MGWILGFVGGIAEYVFLKKAMTALAEGKTGKMAGMMLLNAGCFAITVAIVAIFWRDQLMACGLFMVGALIALSAISFFTQTVKEKGEI